MRPLPFLLFMLLLVGNVVALGLRPPDARVEYEPGKVYQFSVEVINLNDFPVGLETRTTGPLKGYIQVELPQSIPARGAAKIPILITIPMTRERPGNEKSYLYFKEAYSKESQGSFGVRTEVGLTINVWQPYPGYYAEIAASAESVSEGQDTMLRVQINNLGVEPVEDGTATVHVVSAEGIEKDVFTFNAVDVPANSNAAFNDFIPSSTYEPGKYILAAQLVYGNEVSRLNNSFIVGKQDVELGGVEGTFYLDQPVNKFELPVESLWNLPLDGVYAVFALGTKSTQTPSMRLDPFGRSTMSGYWETDTQVGTGIQNASVTLYFPGGVKNYTFPVLVESFTPKIAPLEEEPTIVLSGADIIFAIIAAIIVICIVLFALHRHKDPPTLQPPPSP